MDSLRLLNFWRSDKNNLNIAHALIDSLIAKKDTAFNDRVFTELQPVIDKEPSLLLKKVEVLIGTGEFTEANRAAQALLTLSDNHQIAHHYFLLTLFLQHKFEDVLSYAKLNELMPETQVLVARALFLKGERQAAQETLLKTGIDTADVKGLSALIYLDSGDINNAEQVSNQALQVDDKQFEALLTKASIFVVKHQFEQANVEIQRLLTLQAENGRVLSLKGQAELYKGDLDLALESLTRATDLMSEHIGTWHLLGWTFFLKGQFQRALETFQLALDIDRNFGESHGAVACALVKCGEIDSARKYIKTALKLNKLSFSARYATALVSEESGDLSVYQNTIDKILTEPSESQGDTYQSLIKKAQEYRSQ